MAKRIYRTAMGKTVDVDALLLNNETTIAIGNMKVNARGDEVDGGKIVKTKAQVMQEYYALNTPLAEDGEFVLPETESIAPATMIIEPAIDETPILAEAPTNKPRGSLADAVAQSAEVTQELRDTPKLAAQAAGVKRI